MKKKALLAAAALAALMVPQVAGAEGFGIVEWSAAGTAMSGARMFAEDDVSMIAANPASLTKFQGKGLGANATYISPHGQYEATKKGLMGETIKSEHGENRIHPGIVPGTYYVHQMTDKDWWGIGAYTRYGMVSGFQPGSMPASNNLFAKMNGLSITPVYAHKFDKKWSAAIGAEISYVGLEMNQDFSSMDDYGNYLVGTAQKAGAMAQAAAAAGQVAAAKQAAAIAEQVAAGAKKVKQTAALKTQLKGKSFALGWNAAANYDFDEKNTMGIVYRSKVKHSLEADFKVFTPMGTKVGDAYGVVTLPDQWTIGYGHKFDKKNRLELNATRTNWHTYDALNIMVKKTGIDAMDTMHANPKNYKDTWRYAIGYEHKFSDKYTGMLGFSYDDHAIPYEHGDYVVPTGIRRTYSCGMQYNDKRHTIAFAVAWEKIGGMTIKGNGSSDAYDQSHTHDNFAKIFSIGYQYKF